MKGTFISKRGGLNSIPFFRLGIKCVTLFSGYGKLPWAIRRPLECLFDGAILDHLFLAAFDESNL